MSESKHTPLPWRACQLGSEGSNIYPDCGDIRERGRIICRVTARDTLTDFANAAYIVRACNAFPELVKALHKAREMIVASMENDDPLYDDPYLWFTQMEAGELDSIDEALEKAGGS